MDVRKSKPPNPFLRIMHPCDRQRLESAAQSASVPEIERLLDRISPRLPDAEQIVLDFSAMKGNADVFRYTLRRHPDVFQDTLRRHPDPDLSENLRYYAIGGGVPIWEALLEFKPECLDWDIGLHGNPLGLAVQAKNYELVKFLIDRGINVPASHIIGLPVLQYARIAGVSQECMDLLVQHGSQMDYVL